MSLHRARSGPAKLFSSILSLDYFYTQTNSTSNQMVQTQLSRTKRNTENWVYPEEVISFFSVI